MKKEAARRVYVEKLCRFAPAHGYFAQWSCQGVEPERGRDRERYLERQPEQ